MLKPPTGGTGDRVVGTDSSRRRSSDHYAAGQMAIIGTLDLNETQRDLLRYRWLDEIGRLDAEARADLWRHDRLRVAAIVGSAVAAALVGLSAALPALVGSSAPPTALVALVGVIALVVNLVVAAVLSLDTSFRYADRYRETRLVVEQLRIEGSRYFSLAGTYAVKDATHSSQFPVFMGQVEGILTRDAQDWVSFAVPNPPAGTAADGTTAAATPK